MVEITRDPIDAATLTERVAVGVKDAAGRAATGRYAFHVFLQH